MARHATVLAEAIFREASIRHLGRESDGIQRGINKAVAAAVEHLDKIAKGERQRGDQAGRDRPPTGDQYPRGIIADAMDKVGKDGTITVEEAKSIEPRSTW